MNTLNSIARGLRLALVVAVLFACSETPESLVKSAKDYLAKNPTHRILFEGHCDWRGTEEYNLALGDRRATAAKKYLISLGIAADKVEANSKGSLEAAKNADDATMQKDRRAEIIVLKK